MLGKYLIPFFYVFSYSVHSVQILNIVYLIQAAILFLQRKRKIIFDLRIFLLSVYIGLCILSLCLYTLNHTIDLQRNVIKILFIFNMIIFIKPYLIIKESFEDFVFYYSVCLAILINFLYAFFLMTDVNWLFQQNKEWGGDFFPSWPNSTSIPLLLALWIGILKKRNPFLLFLISTSIVFTFSRAALIAMVALLFTATIFRYKISFARLLFNPFLLFALIVSVIGIYLYTQSMGRNFFIFNERVDTFFFTLSFIYQKPFFGFGGNTLDQLYSSVYFIYDPLLMYPHTHNFILENTLRYGFLSTIFLLIFLTLVFCRIRNSQDRIVFIIFLSLALFQTHFQEFVYLLTLSYIANRSVPAKS